MAHPNPIVFESDWLGVSAPRPEMRFQIARWKPDDSSAKNRSYCPQCGQTLAPGEFRATTSSCATCFNRRFPFQRIIRLGPYTHHLRNWTHHLKFERDVALGQALARHLARSVRTTGIAHEIDLIVPMPMTFRRRFRRGIDHSTLLARVIAKHLNRPLVHALRKVPRPPQRTMSGLKRRANAHNSIHPARFMGIENAHVLLIDDIVTTHSTLIAASRTLRRDCTVSAVSVAVLAVTEDRNHPNLPTSDKHTKHI